MHVAGLFGDSNPREGGRAGAGMVDTSHKIGDILRAPPYDRYLDGIYAASW